VYNYYFSLPKVSNCTFPILTCDPSIHDLGIAGHVEEIAIAKEYQGKGLGLKLLASLSSIAKNVSCYKTILGSGEKNEPFYVKCGYEKSGRVMSQYYEEPKEPYYRG
jgi:glucosamine-phosphate N-acetyltransferase